MDEHELHRRSERATRAKLLIENELFIEAFRELRKAYIDKWANEPALGPEGRECLWQAMKVTDIVEDQLKTIIRNGKIAQHELDVIAAEQERAKQS